LATRILYRDGFDFQIAHGTMSDTMDSEQAPGGSPLAKTVVVVPTFNEAANLPTLVGELMALAVPGLEVLIVDDNSPDGTGRVADTLASRFNGAIRVLHRPEKEGLGRAYVDGMSRALEAGADYVVQMDADFSHPLRAIPEMLAAIKDCDVVVGSRYVVGSQLDERWGWSRRFLSWWANEVWSRSILGLKAQDITAGFKCWRRATLLGIGLNQVKSNGYAFQVEMMYLTERLGYRYREIPIYFEDRRVGRSKMGFSVQIQGAIDVLKIWWYHRRAYRQTPEAEPQH
jgi:dolichol-phosphate mannosyltransferase